MHASLPGLKYTTLFLCSIIIGCLCLLFKAFSFFYSPAHPSLLYVIPQLKCKYNAYFGLFAMITALVVHQA